MKFNTVIECSICNIGLKKNGGKYCTPSEYILEVRNFTLDFSIDEKIMENTVCRGVYS